MLWIASELISINTRGNSFLFSTEGKILVGNYKERDHLEKPRRWWVNSIKLYSKEMG